MIKLVSNNLIEQRLSEFKALHNADDKLWFSEVCFCILTANSQAKKAIAIQAEIGPEGFLNKTQEEIKDIIFKHKHRFHNNKAKYIFEARKFANIKQILSKFNNSIETREFLVKNIKGLGFKEASHFMRNVGYTDVAIIDRHILRFMHKEGLISSIPKTITKKIYLDYEKILSTFGIEQAKLDLIIWQMMTGEVLK